MEKASKSKYAIVNLVCQLLKLGDYGKVESFVSKTVKVLEKEKKVLERNLSNLKLTFESTEEDHKDRIEDLELELHNSYTAIDVDKIKSNADSAVFRENYLDRIRQVEKDIDKENESFKKEQEKHEKQCSELQVELDLRNRRIKKLVSAID